jgi:hypothetical protein
MGHDLRFALRSILSHPWFSAAVVVTVAMGIGVNTMVFTLVNAVLLKPLAVPHGERIVVLSNSNLAHIATTRCASPIRTSAITGRKFLRLNGWRPRATNRVF